MDLLDLQRDLEEIYELGGAGRVDDFLVTDARVAQALQPRGDGRLADEQLLVCQQGDELLLSLYLSEELLARLARDNPLSGLHAGNLADLCLAVEGVSHFLYLSWNAGFDRPVTQVDMELQAEVDKFVAIVRLLQRQGVRYTDAVARGLFGTVSYDAALNEAELWRYRLANQAAQSYCTRLAERHLAAQGARAQAFYADLRRFYRLWGPAKLRYTELS